MWDLSFWHMESLAVACELSCISSPTRIEPRSFRIGSSASQPLGHQEIPVLAFLVSCFICGSTKSSICLIIYAEN